MGFEMLWTETKVWHERMGEATELQLIDVAIRSERGVDSLRILRGPNVFISCTLLF